MKLIVGLGNPHRRYAGTRHNVGWRVVRELARRAGVETWRRTFSGRLARFRRGTEDVALLRPTTYMNRSGIAVRKAVAFWKLDPRDLLVVLDDLNLELGRLRLRPKGSDGGHNGLASVIEHLGHDRFARLRLGIGPAPDPEEHVAFVLAPFAEAERPVVERAVARAADAAQCWAREGLETAMNRFNRPAEP